jgi:hypothetical protein
MGSYLKEKLRLRSRKLRLAAVGTRCADHVAPIYALKFVIMLSASGGRSV